MYFNFEKSFADQFRFVILLATLNVLIPYLYSSIAGLYLFVKNPDSFSKKSLFIYVFVAIVAFLYSLWTIFGSGYEMVLYGCFVLFAGVPIYIVMKLKK